MANASFDLDEALSLSLSILHQSFHFDQALSRDDQVTTPPISEQAPMNDHHMPPVAVTIHDDEVCIVCMEIFESSSGITSGKQITCGHVYHAACISSWLSYSNCCPLCRRTVSGSGSE
ncbi:uncharacterized protein LOC126668742 [Mercurialis annua]|uniref:uncharacterized protein LOC126668742 n=1 Tax=Mercurialis annua TaxID=3986 RepID=UPI00215F22EA|nr:uncharacterized protein LOC126668742 [Mercurialis annua]